MKDGPNGFCCMVDIEIAKLTAARAQTLAAVPASMEGDDVSDNSSFCDRVGFCVAFVCGHGR
jgi:hypothetical protein